MTRVLEPAALFKEQIWDHLRLSLELLVLLGLPPRFLFSEQSPVLFYPNQLLIFPGVFVPVTHRFSLHFPCARACACARECAFRKANPGLRQQF